MTTVKQLIEYLSTLPPEALVECGEEVIGSYSTYMPYSDLDIENCSVFDYSSVEDKVKYPGMVGKIIVQLST